jgi:hypothetical protein
MTLESSEKSKLITDPEGFCSVWCFLWVVLAVKHGPAIERDFYLQLKSENKSLKDVLRSFMKLIATKRDEWLAKKDLTIDKVLYEPVGDSSTLLSSLKF